VSNVAKKIRPPKKLGNVGSCTSNARMPHERPTMCLHGVPHLATPWVHKFVKLRPVPLIANETCFIPREITPLAVITALDTFLHLLEKRVGGLRYK
jgi:hypothetical protein